MCWVLAVALVGVFTVVSTALEGATGGGAGSFQRGDQVAMIGLGLVAAGVVLLFTRPRVEADGHGIRVHNVLGSHDLSWHVVRAVRFDRAAAWASLELHDDEVVPVLAVQAVDRGHAIDAIRAIRALHAARHAPPAAGEGELVG